MPPARTEPVPPIPGLHRYSSRPFPPYRFVPGLNPHPVADPKGHSYRGGAHEPPPPRVAPEQFAGDGEYLYGCDLYNFAYWWEAHEAWEGIWHLTNKQGPHGLFLQGLIQISASNLKRHMGEPEGSIKLATLGLEKLKTVRIATAAGGPMYMGIDVATFSDAARRYLIDREPAAPFPVILLELKNS